MGSGERYYVQSPFGFRKAGQSGMDLCEHWEHLADVADELCVYRVVAESINHPTANYHMNTGNRFGGDPAIGSWVTYGLGSENQDFVSFASSRWLIRRAARPIGPTAIATSLSGHHPCEGFADSHSSAEGVRARKRSNLDLLARLNQQHAAQRAAMPIWPHAWTAMSWLTACR